MINFDQPSVEAFQSRRVFHSCQRTQTESANEWLHRIKYSMETCDYGILNEVMFIDKFLSGLDNEDFAKLSQLVTWSQEQLLQFVGQHQWRCRDAYQNESVETAIDFMPVPEVVIKEEILNDYSEISLASIDVNPISYYADDKDGQVMEISREQDFISTAKFRPGPKRKTLKKEKRPRTYNCQLCGENCLNHNKLKVHMQRHRYTGKIFECYICGIEYRQLRGLKVHYSKIHLRIKMERLSCTECDKTFAERNALEQHIQLHNGLSQLTNSLEENVFGQQLITNNDFQTFGAAKLEKSLICENVDNNNFSDGTKVDLKGFIVNKIDRRVMCLDCGKCFKQKNSYNHHRRLHIGMNSYNCNLCGKRFTDETLLKSHVQELNHQNGSFECYLCTTKYEQLLNLRLHFIRLHTPRMKRDFQCTLCTKAFSAQRDLDFHIKVHRGLIAGHKCQHCNKIFDKRWALNKHVIMHLKTKEFICETCGRAYKSDNQLKQHATTHNANRRFKCPECGQELSSSSTLKLHMRQHTGERPHACNLCEKKFINRSTLIKHLRVHRNERPHSCNLCDKKFATLYHLQRHMNTHTGARLYSCNLCDRSFMQNGTLKAHQLKIHATDNTFN